MKNIRTVSLLLAALLAFATGVFAQAANQNPRPDLNAIYDAISSVRQFGQAAIAPNGERVAWVESANGGRIFVQDLKSGSAPRQISAAKGGASVSEGNVAWSPDSRQIAFLSDASGLGQAQVYVADIRGTARKLTSLKGYLSYPRWSPDGKSVAFLFIENAPRIAGPLVPMTPDAGLIEEHIYEQRIATADVTTGAVRQVSPADMYVYEYDWSPDGKQFVASAAHGSGDNNWWIAQLYTLPAAGGAMRSIYKPPLQIAVPRWSPDGKNIAFIGGLMSDEAVIGGDVWVVPAEGGGEARNLTPQLPASPSWLNWDAQRVLFAENVDGNAGIAAVDLSGKVETLWTAQEAIAGATDVYGMSLSLAADGKQSALIRQSFKHPPEIWAGEIGKWKQVTSANANAKPQWGEGHSAFWKSDGMKVQGWLLYPRNFDPSKRYPLVVQVHGGPASDCTAAWPGLATGAMAAAGYFVLCPNPRGSFGQGEAFTEGNVKDFGGGDFRDIMAGVDEVLGDLQTLIDKDRVGIKGHSYGGYMTMWAVTQTNRFKAAVAGAGLSNWLSYYGENDIDQWMMPYFGASVYDDPAVYAKSSPINFVKNVKTPTLILVGDRDGEVPAPQSYEWYHALKTLGVPTQFVVYPNEGHMIAQPEHKRDMTVRTVQWFDRWMPEKKGSSATAK